jgi:hypothetical protein
VLTDVESEVSLTQHRPLTLSGFRAVYFNIKYGKSGGENARKSIEKKQ